MTDRPANTALAALAVMMLTGCATAEAPAPTLDEALSWLEGDWSNAAQYEAAPEALKREPAPGHPYDWLDLQHAEFHRVTAPALGDEVVYLEWRSGGPDGPVSRQRIWVFHADEAGRAQGMDFYTFRTPDPYAGRGSAPGAFAALSPAELIGYPDGCTLTAQIAAPARIVFRADPAQCRITARSGRQMGIRAQVDIAPSSLRYAEAGILEGGAYAFLVPGGEDLAYGFAPDQPGR